MGTEETLAEAAELSRLEVEEPQKSRASSADAAAGARTVPFRLPLRERGPERRVAEPIAPVAPEKRPDANAAAGHSVSRPATNRRIRWALCALLLIAAATGAYRYGTGGQVRTTDDAYVRADKVGSSTEVSGIVQE